MKSSSADNFTCVKKFVPEADLDELWHSYSDLDMTLQIRQILALSIVHGVLFDEGPKMVIYYIVNHAVRAIPKTKCIGYCSALSRLYMI